MAEDRRQLAPGMTVSKGVTLRSPLGEGGMGAVWLAEHAGLQTQVVVKFMIGGLDKSTQARARFAKEAAAAAQVKSPHVVQMLDHGITDDDVPFIVMEHLVGKSLGQYMEDHGVMPVGQAVSVISQVAKALGRVHAAGLLHRDIKPDNIFLCEGEDELYVKLLDFGIVKENGAEPALDSQTKTGQVVGTPYYMSPEQMNAEKTIDARSDLWSLAVVAFEALTGSRPFNGPSFGALAVAIVTTAPPRASSLNPALPTAVDAWFERALAREPAKRFPSAREMTEALRASFGAAGNSLLPPSTEPSGPTLRSALGTPHPEGASGVDSGAKTERIDRPPTPIELDATIPQDSQAPLASSSGSRSSPSVHALARSEPARDKATLPPPKVSEKNAERRAAYLAVAAVVVVAGVIALVTSRVGGVASAPAVGRSPDAPAQPAAPTAAALAAPSPSIATSAVASATASAAPSIEVAAARKLPPSVATKPDLAVRARPAQVDPLADQGKARSAGAQPPTATATAAPPASTPRPSGDPLY